MQFDLISIFPGYFAPLDLSLMGKAKAEGRVSVHVHDLRDWTNDPHRTVDDSPAGGGAGMVMKPDVWGRAIESVRGNGRVVLAIPSPSGALLGQRKIEDLADADQIIVACGRYEGIDARVGEYYDEVDGVEVFEFSIGDYVLNGGEVAALALVEATSRLLENFMGNPDSLVEESHGDDGLLEYPAYTQPNAWNGLVVPPILKSGDHARIARWRRDQAVQRTVRRRPDLLPGLANLDSRDHQVLAEEGWLIKPEVMEISIEKAGFEDIGELAALAARTFPDACPPGMAKEDIDQFIGEFLSEQAFAGYLADPKEWLVLVARTPFGLAAYTLTAFTCPDDMAFPDAAYLSKCYTDDRFRGSGLTAALIMRTMQEVKAPRIVLATNARNARAAKFYKKMGFKKAGRRDFYVGTAHNLDDVFVCDLTAKDEG
jgi:tRNA (guanine-N1)-methyltransferase